VEETVPQLVVIGENLIPSLRIVKNTADSLGLTRNSETLFDPFVAISDQIKTWSRDLAEAIAQSGFKFGIANILVPNIKWLNSHYFRIELIEQLLDLCSANQPIIVLELTETSGQWHKQQFDSQVLLDGRIPKREKAIFYENSHTGWGLSLNIDQNLEQAIKTANLEDSNLFPEKIIALMAERMLQQFSQAWILLILPIIHEPSNFNYRFAQAIIELREKYPITT
jgi:hypothetical protein